MKSSSVEAKTKRRSRALPSHTSRSEHLMAAYELIGRVITHIRRAGPDRPISHETTSAHSDLLNTLQRQGHRILEMAERKRATKPARAQRR